MNHSRSNSKARVPVTKDAKQKPIVGATSSNKEIKSDTGRNVNSKVQAARSDKSKLPITTTKKDQSSKRDLPTRSISKDRAKEPVARAVSKDRTKEPVTRAVSKDRTKEPVTRGVSKDREKIPTNTIKDVSRDRSKGNANLLSKTSRPSQATKPNVVKQPSKALESKPSKPVPPRNGTATISKSKSPAVNGSEKKVSKEVAADKSTKPKLSGSRTATKEKTVPSEDVSEKEERPSTVNLSSRKGENRVLRNPESIIANNETVLNLASNEKTEPDQDSLDAEIDYEDDFEDYESDFEVDDEDYDDDDERSESDATSDSEMSFSETSDALNSEKKDTVQPETINETYTEIKKNSNELLSVNTKSETKAKPVVLGLYEGKPNSESSFESPMSPITVTPMTPTVPLLTPMTPSASLFNFAQAEHSIIQRKSKSRSSELLELITLDKQTFNIYDSPPANYEVFIKIFGNCNRKQVFVQTESSEEQSTQTDDIDSFDKWTQNPAHGLREVGGDLTPEIIESWKIEVNGVKLNSFIANSSSLISKILDEETVQVLESGLNKNDATVPFSSGYFDLDILVTTFGQPVTHLCFSEGQPTYLLSIHSSKNQNTDTVNDEQCTICVWDLKNSSRPQYILMPSSVASKACFNPGNPKIVFAGMMDGSVALWDLGEQDYQHKYLSLAGDAKITSRIPTYSTAAVEWETSHHSAIIALQTFVYQNSSVDAPNENHFCNLLTLEDLGVLNIWSVVGVAKADSAGSEVDLGLAPRGNLKLLKTSSILISSMLPSASALSVGLRSWDFAIEPNSPHNLFISTDAGVVLHCTRQGHLSMPRLYETDTNKEVRCLAFNPHRLPHFATGCNDGTVYIYNKRSSKPVLKCLYKPYGIVKVQWSVIRPTVFYVLDSQSFIQVWDLAVNSTSPIFVGDFQENNLTYFTVVLDRLSNSQWSQYIVISHDTGHIKVFKLVDSLITVTSDDYDLLRNIMNDL